MTIFSPEGVKAQGNRSVTVVQTIEDTSAPALSEINDATSVNVSCALINGAIGSATQNKGEAPRRVCTTNTFEEFGNTSFTMSDLQYLYAPQEDSDHADNKAKTALTPGTEVFVVERLGLSAENDAYDGDQLVNIWKIRLGVQNRTQTGDGDMDQFSITQPVAVIASPVFDVAIVDDES